MAVDLLVTDGIVVTSTEMFHGGVAVDDGVIVAVGQAGGLPEGRQVLSAGGNYILPGLIDPHVHFRDPGLTYKEDFTSGSMAALMGGVTTVLDMPNVLPPTSTAERVRERQRLIEAKSYIDVMLVGVIVQDNLDETKPMAEAGVVGFKVFLGTTVGGIPAPDDGTLLDAMSAVAETGRRIGFHAENDGIIQHRALQLQAQGRADLAAHVESRPALAEVEAIQRIALFAEQSGAKTHIFHLSSRDGLNLITRCRANGLDITAETGPHYMFLDAGELESLGSIAKVNPPVRSREHGEVLFRGLLEGAIDFLASDHAPHTEEEKMKDSVWQAMAGFVGVETMVQVMLSEAVNKRGMGLTHFVRVCAENAARAWGVYPRKGTLQVGADADLTIVDLEMPWTIDGSRLHSKSRVTPWHSYGGIGRPVTTVARGRVLMKDGAFTGSTPQGKLVQPA